jgi:hypothetical protein
MSPLCIDLFCGLGGWSEVFLAEGWDVVGFDIERHRYGSERYPGQLVLQDVLTIHGSQFRNADCIVASPPCQRYSYMAMPWSRAKREIQWQEWERDSPFGNFTLNDLFNACFRIQREASEAAGRHIPLVVENVVGAQRWVGRAAWHHGSFYLWGDVPALMPHVFKFLKQPGRNEGVKQGGSGPEWFDKALDERRKEAGTKAGGDWFGTYADQKADGTISPGRLYGSHSDSRKAVSAMIAKIPFELASYVARYYKPCPIDLESSRRGAIREI